jgi:hypothetical protein
MPGPNGVPIHVNVNFNGISYDPNTQQWTIPANTPSWNVPATVPVPPGNNVLTWNLDATHVPTGFNAEFDPSTGIQFAAGWPGGAPYMVDEDTIQCTDDFTSAPNNPTYYYSITVNLVQTSGTVSKPFTLDPDIKNKGAGIMHTTIGAGAVVAAE